MWKASSNSFLFNNLLLILFDLRIPFGDKVPNYSKKLFPLVPCSHFQFLVRGEIHVRLQTPVHADFLLDDESQSLGLKKVFLCMCTVYVC